MMNLLKINVADVAMCEICDNYTPRVYVEEFQQECCEYCFEAYGECNQYEQIRYFIRFYEDVISPTRENSRGLSQDSRRQ